MREEIIKNLKKDIKIVTTKGPKPIWAIIHMLVLELVYEDALEDIYQDL